MNPAFSTGLVIPTCTARQCKGKRDKRLNTPDIDFATCFQQILAPPKQTLSTCRPGGMSEGEPTLTGVHGVNLGGVMIGRREGEGGGQGRDWT